MLFAVPTARAAVRCRSRLAAISTTSVAVPTASASQRMSHAQTKYKGSSHGYGHPSFFTVASATLATSFALSMSSCESAGPAHETDGSESVTFQEEDDDPNNDEETTCSICLINRQGPCRKHWLKFEKCMKEHSAEKEKEEWEKSESEVVEKEETDPTLEDEWDAFMEKSSNPGEEDDDDDEEDGDDEDNDDDKIETENTSENSSPSLGERCDRFMIPWISCIQEHRNVYSLISNAFYQKDYVDPLEDSVAQNKRQSFIKTESNIGENDGYIVKLSGAEIDLGSWREFVEAASERGGEILDVEENSNANVPKNSKDPHLINAYVKFKLTQPGTGNPIEVAYIKDQKGRLLGFDSFSKRDSSENESEDNTLTNQEKKEEADDGECSFHIVPSETTSIAAYAIYRTETVDDNGEKRKDFVLYSSSMIPLPGLS